MEFAASPVEPSGSRFSTSQCGRTAALESASAVVASGVAKHGGAQQVSGDESKEQDGDLDDEPEGDGMPEPLPPPSR